MSITLDDSNLVTYGVLPKELAGFMDELDSSGVYSGIVWLHIPCQNKEDSEKIDNIVANRNKEVLAKMFNTDVLWEINIKHTRGNHSPCVVYKLRHISWMFHSCLTYIFIFILSQLL